MGERREKAEQREIATYREITLPVGCLAVETTDDLHFIISGLGSVYGERFNDWNVRFDCTRAPYRTRADIPPSDFHSYWWLDPSDGSNQFIAFIDTALAARNASPYASARLVWGGRRYRDELIGAFPTKDDLLRAYVGLEMLLTAGEAHGGRPTGQPNGFITPDLKAIIITLATNWRAKSHNWGWITRELERRYPYGEYEHHWTKGGLSIWLKEQN